MNINSQLSNVAAFNCQPENVAVKRIVISKYLNLTLVIITGECRFNQTRDRLSPGTCFIEKDSKIFISNFASICKIDDFCGRSDEQPMKSRMALGVEYTTSFKDWYIYTFNVDRDADYTIQVTRCDQDKKHACHVEVSHIYVDEVQVNCADIQSTDDYPMVKCTVHLEEGTTIMLHLKKTKNHPYRSIIIALILGAVLLFCPVFVLMLAPLIAGAFVSIRGIKSLGRAVMSCFAYIFRSKSRMTVRIQIESYNPELVGRFDLRHSY